MTVVKSLKGTLMQRETNIIQYSS